MQWTNDGNHIKIEEVTDVDIGSVTIISSSLRFSDLPIEFREQIAKTDVAATRNLIALVDQWARKKGYVLNTEA